MSADNTKVTAKGEERERLRLQRKARRQQERRDKIIAEARRLLEQGGADALTMATLAGAAGMSARTLYYYFPSQEAVADALCAMPVREQTDAMVLALQSAAGGVDSLAAIMQARFDHYIDRPATFRALYEFIMSVGISPQTLQEQVYPQSARVMGELERRLAADQASGTVHCELRPRLFANVGFMAVQGVLTTSIGMAAAGGTMRFGAQVLVDEAIAMVRRAALPNV